MSYSFLPGGYPGIPDRDGEILRVKRAVRADSQTAGVPRGSHRPPQNESAGILYERVRKHWNASNEKFVRDFIDDLKSQAGPRPETLLFKFENSRLCILGPSLSKAELQKLAEAHKDAVARSDGCKPIVRGPDSTGWFQIGLMAKSTHCDTFMGGSPEQTEFSNFPPYSRKSLGARSPIPPRYERCEPASPPTSDWSWEKQRGRAFQEPGRDRPRFPDLMPNRTTPLPRVSDSIEDLIKQAGHQNEQVRRAAMVAIIQHPDQSSAADALKALSTNSRWPTREAVAKCLSEQASGGFEILLALAGDKVEHVREATIAGLARDIAKPASLAALMLMATDSSWLIRQAVAKCVSDQQAGGFEILLALADDKDADVRKATMLV